MTRERPEFQGRQPMNPYAGWLATLHNPHFRRLLLAFTCSGIGLRSSSRPTPSMSMPKIEPPTWSWW